MKGVILGVLTGLLTAGLILAVLVSPILDHGGLKLDCMLLLRASLGLVRAAGSFGGYGDSSVGVLLCHKIITKASKERTSDRIWLGL